MTNPINSAFTVKVDFNGTFYDVKIQPTLDGRPLEWMPDRVNQWVEAENTHKVFSQKIREMLEKANIPAERSLETLGVINSVDGFRVPETKDATQIVWNEFIDRLKHTNAYTAGRDPVGRDEGVLGTGEGFGITFTRDVYLNLEKGSRTRAVRLSLFEKKTWELFGLPFKPYTPEEESCFEHLFQHRKTRLIPSTDVKETAKFELVEWFSNEHLLLVRGNAQEDEVLSKQELLNERKAMSRIYSAVQQRAPIAMQRFGFGLDSEYSDSESTDLSSTEEEKKVVSVLVNTTVVNSDSGEFYSLSSSEDEVAFVPVNTTVVTSGSAVRKLNPQVPVDLRPILREQDLL